MEKFKNSIYSVFDKTTGEYINLKNIKIISCDPIYKFVINDKIINRKNKYVIIYNCLECNRENSVSLNSFVGKINKNIIKCRNCCESCRGIMKESEREFKNLGDKIVDQYFRKYLDKEEYDYIKSKIISIQNGRIRDIDDYLYCPYIKCETKFIPKLYHLKKDIFEEIKYIKFRCEKCSNEFVDRYLNIQKNKLKIYCRNCKNKY